MIKDLSHEDKMRVMKMAHAKLGKKETKAMEKSEGKAHEASESKSYEREEHK